jgi:hypothetical protein
MQYNRNPARGVYLSELAYEPICLGAFPWTSPQLAIPTGTSRWAETLSPSHVTATIIANLDPSVRLR